MLVPLSERRPPPTRAETTPTPGALICGKVLEKGATTRPLPVGDCASAPTAMTPSAAAGSDTAISKSGPVWRSLSFPAAATTRVPGLTASRAATIRMSASKSRRLARYASSASDVANLGCRPRSTRRCTMPGKSNPSDMEITCAPWRSAHSIPRSSPSVSPLPSSASTLPITARVTPGATPILVPSTARPKIVPAQWVPCPCLSPTPEPLKSSWMRVTPVNAGWLPSMPVSRTATITSAPVRVETSAPTALTPQVAAAAAASAVARSSAPSSNGWMSMVGMTGATARTSGSREMSRSSCLASSSTSTCGSPPARTRAGSGPGCRADSKGLAVLTPLMSRSTLYLSPTEISPPRTRPFPDGGRTCPAPPGSVPSTGSARAQGTPGIPPRARTGLTSGVPARTAGPRASPGVHG